MRKRPNFSSMDHNQNESPHNVAFSDTVYSSIENESHLLDYSEDDVSFRQRSAAAHRLSSPSTSQFANNPLFLSTDLFTLDHQPKKIHS